MRKALDKIRSRWKVLLVTIVAVVAICSFIDWIWDKYGQDYALMWVSLFIAVIVAIVALESLRVTSQSLKTTRTSLELTRATARPFLTYTKFGLNFPGNSAAIHIWISNTGIYPADNSLVDIEVFTLVAEDGREQELRSERYPSATFFPKEELIYSIGVAAEYVDLIKTEKVYVRISIDYGYRLRGTEHETVQTGRIVREKSGISNFALELINDKCYWY